MSSSSLLATEGVASASTSSSSSCASSTSITVGPEEGSLWIGALFCGEATGFLGHGNACGFIKPLFVGEGEALLTTSELPKLKADLELFPDTLLDAGEGVLDGRVVAGVFADTSDSNTLVFVLFSVRAFFVGDCDRRVSDRDA